MTSAPSSDSHAADTTLVLANLPAGVDLRLLRYFAVLAETLNFRAAAERLNMSQPPLSRAIQDLEQRLEVILFHRSRRSVTLTEAGRQFLTNVRTVLSEMENAVDSVRLVQRGRKGQIKIGYFGSLIYSFIPWILSAFQEHYPNVEPRLFNLPKDQQVASVLEGRIDIGFARQYPQHAGLCLESLVEEPLVLATPASGRLATRRELSLAELDDEPLVVFPRLPRPSFADSVITLISSAGASPRVILEMDDAAGCLAMVSAGRGSAIMPASMKMFQGDATRFIPFAPPVPSSPVACIYAEEFQTLQLRNFLEIVRERASEYGRERS